MTAERRIRWPDDLDPKLRGWLTRVARVGAHMKAQLAIYGRGRNVGGDSLIGNTAYNERAASRDRTILTMPWRSPSTNTVMCCARSRR